MPKYSVIMTAYNRAAYLRQAVDSVLGQTFRDFEVVVYDDGSTDETPAILKSYGDRIRTSRGPNKGMGPAANAALAMAQGTFVSMLDSDDFWMPWTLEQVDRVVDAVEQPAGVYLRPTFFFGEGVPRIEAAPQPASFRVFNSYAEASDHVPIGSGMLGALPRQLLMDVGGFWDLPYCCMDGDLMYRLSRRMRYVILGAPVTVCVRQHRGRSLHHLQNRFEGVSQVLANHRCGAYGYGADDPLVTAKVGQLALAQALDLATKFGAWRESGCLFRRTMRILPGWRRPGMSAWYGAFLVAIMTSRLLEQFSRHCSRRVSASWSDPDREPKASI